MSTLVQPLELKWIESCEISSEKNYRYEKLIIISQAIISPDFLKTNS